MKLISFHIPEGYIESLDELVSAKVYPSRAHALREAVRELLLKNDLFFRKRS